MKIVFFGSGKFAVKVLESLHQSNREIVLVVTQPDRKKGRHLHLGITPVKDYAVLHQLKIFQPEHINQSESLARLKSENADIFVVVSYGRILSKDALALPKKMCVNIHASLLPKYRGAAPINRALMDGAKGMGVTFIQMNEFMDKGDIIFKKSVPIGRSDNILSLDNNLSEVAACSVNKVLDLIETGKINLKKQNDKIATYAPLMKKQDGLIDWKRSPRTIYDQFRGCFGWPGSFTHLNGKMLKILAMKMGKRKKVGKCGEIIAAHDNILEVACLSGSVLITEVLPESHARMPVKSFLAGHHVSAGDMLGL